VFTDRTEAGRRLADRLSDLRAHPDVVVVGLPRGGVPVAAEVAESLGAPLDVIVVRKLGVPFQPELALGAIGEDDVRVVNDDLVRMAGVTEDEIAEVEARERIELDRRAEQFRRGRTRIRLTGRVVVVVDDGVATGSTARAACQVARAEGAARVVLAVPVAPTDWTDRLGDVADELIAVETPTFFMAVGQHYRDFDQTTDDEVIRCLDRVARHVERLHDGDDPLLPFDDDVAIDLDDVSVGGHLTVPDGAHGVVLFAHGSGSSRHSPRNRYVAAVLNEARLATLLFDLLTEQEEFDRANVFDIELLAARLLDVTAWLRRRPGFADAHVGFFGASTGAGAALWAAADPRDEADAVVSRGGRPDLAGPKLAEVTAPTLLIVGGMDRTVLDLNREAEKALPGRSELAIVPGATHLFEEPGALATAAGLARDWFVTHLASASPLRAGGNH
jgi:predicted phosphoribosyltransferase/dienelactone hydrolase